MKPDDVAKKMGFLERKITQGEQLLRTVERLSIGNWVLIAAGLVMIIWLDIIYKILGGVLILAGVWLMYSMMRFRRTLEQGLIEYRGRKAELQATLLTRQK